MAGSFGSKNRVRVGGEFDDQISGKLDKLRDKFDTLGKSKGAQSILMGVGLGAGTMALNAVGSAVERVGDLAVSAINDASNLAETVSKGRVIFGDSADEIEAWADTAADAFGQSKRQAIDTAAGFAGLFDTVGLSLDTSTKYAKDLTELGADLASFFNTDVDSALQALKSGLSGESEPLRKFNVFLSETAVQAKAVELGIAKAGAKLTEAQKATARYAIIMEQTGSAQGDFARTADGLANSQRTVAAQMEDLSASVGEDLLPIMLELMTFVKNEGIPAIEGLTDAGRTLVPVLLEIATSSTDVFAAIGGIGDGSKDASTRVKELADSILGTIPIIGWAYGESVKWIESLDDLSDEAAAAALELDTGSERIATANANAGGSFEDLGRESGEAAGDVDDAAEDMVESAADMRDRFKGIVREIVDGYYAPLRDAQELTAVEAELAAERKILADRKSTAEEKANANERILKLQEQRAELRLLMGVMGELEGDTSDVRKTLIREWATATGEAKADIQSLINKIYGLVGTYEDLNSKGFNILTVGGIEHKAAGGPVQAGVPYIVNEEGPELFVPDTNGTIVPAGQTAALLAGGGGSGTPVEIPIVLDGREIARVVDQHLFYR